MASGSDRGRIVRKIALSLRGARLVASKAEPHPDQPSPMETAGDIWVLTPLPIPLPGLRIIRRFNGWLYRTLARKWAGRIGFDSPVLINYVPVLANAMKNWNVPLPVRIPHQPSTIDHQPSTIDHQPSTINHQPFSFPLPRVVYHCVDKWDSFEMYDSATMREMDEQCCCNADLVIASSSELLEQCRKLNSNSHLVMHGVDHEHFASAVGDQPGEERPSDLPEGRVVGFFGLLSEWLDQELVVKLARSLREASGGTPGPASLVLIGTADVPINRLKDEPNIFMLGPKPFSELPRYIRHFYVGIIPFVVNDLTRAVNPIKLREMLAAGCPVVSTALPEVERIADSTQALLKSVSVVENSNEFIAAVKEILQSPLSANDRRTISDSMIGETWKAKVEEILSVITGREI